MFLEAYSENLHKKTICYKVNHKLGFYSQKSKLTS